MDSLQSAQPYVSFDVYVPRGMPDAETFVSPNAYASPSRAGDPNDASALFLVYQTTDFGTVWIGEAVPDDPTATQDDLTKLYQQRVDENSSHQLTDTASIVTIRGGIPALLLTSNDSKLASIQWIEYGIDFTILGSGLTADGAQSLANSV